MLISVDLPAPFSPTMPVMAPLAMASDTPRTACTLPNDFWMPKSSIAGAAVMLAPLALSGLSGIPGISGRDPGGKPPHRPPRGGRPIARDFFRHPERSRLKGGVVEGPVFADASTKQVPPLRLASLGSGRDDGSLGRPWL